MVEKKFYGRKAELQAISELHNQKKASFLAVTGRRRIGKSSLIAHYASKNSIKLLKFQGLAPNNLGKKEQLRHFVEELALQTNFPKIKVESWSQIFQILSTQIVDSKKTVLFFDEISWMAEGSNLFLSELKIAWDEFFSKKQNLLFVICGSVSYWIEKNIISSTAFLGRIDLTINLREMPLDEAKCFWKENEKRQIISNREKLMLLAITGGVPRYLESINYNIEAISNVKNLCFTKGALLVNEFEQIFNDVFGKRTQTYRKIIESLVYGSQDFSSLIKEIGEEKKGGKTSQYLDDLEKAGFIGKYYNWDFDSKKDLRTQHYKLKDNYTRFYLRYIKPNLSRIDKDIFSISSFDLLLNFDQLVALQFENLVLNSIEVVLKKLNLYKENIVNYGPYLQKKTIKNRGCQIDLLIQTKNTLYLCEVKFKKIIGSEIIDEIKSKVDSLKHHKALSIKPVLIYEGKLDPVVEEYFAYKISFSDLIGD